LIHEMTIAKPLWGAPRIHGELLKLDIDIGQISVAKYMARRRGPPWQGWKTLVRNHADGIVAMDLCRERTSPLSLSLSKLGDVGNGHLHSAALRVAFDGQGDLVCTENLIRVDDVMESPKLAE
jgi:hypothetical protein